MEPGNRALPRLAVSMSSDDEQLLTKLKHHLEAKGCKRLSASEVVRQAIKCLAQREGVA